MSDVGVDFQMSQPILGWLADLCGAFRVAKGVLSFFFPQRTITRPGNI
jgi:hypothetical protein